MWKSIAVYGAITTLNRAVVFLGTLLLTRSYSPADIGTYVLTYTFAQLAIPMLSLGGATVVLRETAEDIIKGFGTLQFYVAFVAAAFCLALAAGFAIPILPDWIKFGLLVGSLDAAQTTLTSYFQARDRIGSAVLLTLAKTLCFLAILIWAVFDGWTLHELLWGQVVQGVFVGLLPALIVAGPAVLASIKALFDQHVSSVVYGLKGVPHTFALWIISNSDRLLLGTFGSKAALGVYVLSYTVAQCVMLPHSGFAAVFSVNVARDEAPWLQPGRIERLVLTAGLASTLVLSAACVAVLIEMHFVHFVNWGDGPIFVRAGVIASGMVLSLGYLTFASFTLRRRMTGTISRMTIAAAAFSAPCSLALVIAFCGIGAALSVLVGYAAMAVLYFREAARLIPEFKQRRWRFLGLAVLICGLHVAAGAAFQLAAGWPDV